jgi:hypothetical protein
VWLLAPLFGILAGLALIVGRSRRQRKPKPAEPAGADRRESGKGEP